MKNLKTIILSVFAASLVLASCIKHEVIPPPSKKVDLYCHFQGNINGTDVKWTQNVNGYTCVPSREEFIVPSPELSGAAYYAKLCSSTKVPSIELGLGSVAWDASVADIPTLSLFNDFYKTNLNPIYSDGAIAGFEVRYRDAQGLEWTSHQNSVNFQNVVFSDVTQESDDDGDYSSFKCDFNCYVYFQNPLTSVWDSLQISGAQFSGWFKR